MLPDVVSRNRVNDNEPRGLRAAGHSLVTPRVVGGNLSKNITLLNDDSVPLRHGMTEDRKRGLSMMVKTPSKKGGLEQQQLQQQNKRYQIELKPLFSNRQEDQLKIINDL